MKQASIFTQALSIPERRLYRDVFESLILYLRQGNEHDFVYNLPSAPAFDISLWRRTIENSDDLLSFFSHGDFHLNTSAKTLSFIPYSSPTHAILREFGRGIFS